MTTEVEERAGFSGCVELGTVGEDMADVAEDGAGVSGKSEAVGVPGEGFGAAVRLVAIDKLEGKEIGT